jgi:hypothetical protein
LGKSGSGDQQTASVMLLPVHDLPARRDAIKVRPLLLSSWISSSSSLFFRSLPFPEMRFPAYARSFKSIHMQGEEDDTHSHGSAATQAMELQMQGEWPWSCSHSRSRCTHSSLYDLIRFDPEVALLVFYIRT